MPSGANQEGVSTFLPAAQLDLGDLSLSAKASAILGN